MNKFNYIYIFKTAFQIFNYFIVQRKSRNAKCNVQNEKCKVEIITLCTLHFTLDLAPLAAQCCNVEFSYSLMNFPTCSPSLPTIFTK